MAFENLIFCIMISSLCITPLIIAQLFFCKLSQGANKGKVLLQGVTGDISAGEVTAVLGPSGAGKTTFLNVLCGKAFYGVCV